ncbi:unnamed protein product, partial [marine sediment metagenome]
PELPHLLIKPFMCTKHRVALDFRRQIKGFTDMYFCPECHREDLLIPAKYIEWWKDVTWNNNWKAGDVKFTVSPDYKMMMERR